MAQPPRLLLTPSQGMTPLHIAADRGHEDIARLLLAKGADTRIQVRNALYDGGGTR